MNGWAVFLILVFVALCLFGIGWTIQRQFRARRLGLPAPSLNPFASSSARNTGNSGGYNPPAPAPGGIGGWIKDKFSSLRNTRTSAGAYESTSFNNNNRRRGGFDPLDPDEAWDSRVGNEADYAAPGGHQAGYGYEETEMGLRDPGSGPYGGGGYGEDQRGRVGQRELDDRYDEEMGRKGRADPFGDGAERSDLRGVSPRPMENHDRRSAFREDM
ncbi:hypothetical protein K461DRAFT_298433 [Myriangium duriaei CBS 260.36]|uniref:Uncharacterized protein n=1 Tax=Myriangium duriaei CBS 260.36 TaxID=1168546 RepID=A0A9P4MHF4_9PEZI|nr:hypothetical protein K461DRAFT_298433 [Myriangium duriaei CBS 260.36]